jgi:hypothetical protein
MQRVAVDSEYKMSSTTVQKLYGELLSLSVAERFEVVQLAMDSLQRECADVLPSRKRSLLELRGLGKEIWEGIDPGEYVKQERDSWER